MDSYYTKIVISGQIVEFWKYEKLNTKGGGSHRTKEESPDKLINYERQDKERRRRIRQLATTNFDNHCKFITLTFDPKKFEFCKDVIKCNYYFKKFVQRLTYKIGKFKYLAVIEFQDGERKTDQSDPTGNVHYHVLIDRKRLDQKVLLETWGYGLIYVENIRQVDNVGAYISKYMTKDLHDPRLMDKPAYLHSRGLIEPTVISSWKNDSEEIYNFEKFAKEKELVFSANYTSSSSGKISYKQFNLNRKNSNVNKKL